MQRLKAVDYEDSGIIASQEQLKKEEHKNSGKIGPDRKPVETQNQTGEQ